MARSRALNPEPELRVQRGLHSDEDGESVHSLRSHPSSYFARSALESLRSVPGKSILRAARSPPRHAPAPLRQRGSEHTRGEDCREASSQETWNGVIDHFPMPGTRTPIAGIGRPWSATTRATTTLTGFTVLKEPWSKPPEHIHKQGKQDKDLHNSYARLDRRRSASLDGDSFSGVTSRPSGPPPAPPPVADRLDLLEQVGANESLSHPARRPLTAQFEASSGGGVVAYPVRTSFCVFQFPDEMQNRSLSGNRNKQRSCYRGSRSLVRTAFKKPSLQNLVNSSTFKTSRVRASHAFALAVSWSCARGAANLTHNSCTIACVEPIVCSKLTKRNLCHRLHLPGSAGDGPPDWGAYKSQRRQDLEGARVGAEDGNSRGRANAKAPAGAAKIAAGKEDEKQGNPTSTGFGSADWRRRKGRSGVYLPQGTSGNVFQDECV